MKLRKLSVFIISLMLSFGVVTPNHSHGTRPLVADTTADAYYANLDTSLSGENFISKLSALINTNYKTYPYTSSSTDVWDILAAADEDPDNSDNIKCIYSGLSIPKNCQDGSAPTGAEHVWNREHVWCKSHGFPNESDSPAYTDCHHLHAVEKVINTTRNNLDFDEKENYSTYTDYGSLTNKAYGAGNYYGSNFFEPRDEVKGDVARSLLYMAVKYNDDTALNLVLTDSVPTAASANKQGKLGKFSTLLKWNYEDPVDEQEKKRNDIVYSYQNNRNPFVDHNEYVAICWPNTYAGNSKTNPTSSSSSSTMEPDVIDTDDSLTTEYKYTKIENDPVNWEGEYIVVNEENARVFDGSLDSIDVVGNSFELTSSNSVISGNTITTAKLSNKTIKIQPYSTGYSIQTYSGLYIGNTANNKNRIDSSKTTAYLNTLSMASDGVDIIGEAEAHLRYSPSTNNGLRFRYYQPSTYANQKPISLYRVIEDEEENIITFDSMGGSEVESEDVSTLSKLTKPTNPTKEGYTFGGWYTDTDCTQAYDFNNIVYSNFTLYAKWSKDEFLQEVQDALDGIRVSARFDLEYTKESAKAYRKVTDVSQIDDGASIIIASHYGEKDYAVSASVGTAAKSVAPTEIQVSGNICETQDSSILWKVVKNGEYYYLYNEATAKYLSTISSGTDCNLYDSRPSNKNHFADLGSGNIGYVIDGTSISQNALILRDDTNQYFKNYKVSNIGASGYASGIAVYEYTDVSNVSVKLQLRFEMDEDLVGKQTCTAIGFTYQYGSDSVYLNYTDLTKNEENGKTYYIYETELGDVINGASLSILQRSVTMSCVNNEVTYTSTKNHSFTVLDLAKKYLSEEKDRLSDRLVALLEGYIAMVGEE